MRDLAILFIHLVTTIVRLLGPGGARSIVAESLLIKHQLLIVNRSRERAPNLRIFDRIIAGLCAILMSPNRILRSAVILRPSTILGFHRTLVKHKYQRLFTSKTHSKPGPKGPSRELIKAIVTMKQFNSNWGCPRIAQQISLAFGIDIDKDIVRRVLARHYRSRPNGSGPSGLTFLGHMKDSLWSVDMFRCESATLRSHWVLVVIDQYTRRIIGFAVNAGPIDGPMLCRMFNFAVEGEAAPKYLSSDNDPLFRFHRWLANLRIRNVKEIKTIPYVPLSHPYIERLIGTVRCECIDKTLFWTECDLERKLLNFKDFYNEHRTHDALGGVTPVIHAELAESNIIDINNYRWKSHCRGLYQTPIAA